MFTGIVEEVGRVEAVADQGDAVRLTVHGPRVVADAGQGDSIAVDGCCLTVSERDGSRFVADVMAETLDKTTLGGLRPGHRVNLERAVTAATRLGGHVVQGHVDATGEIAGRTRSEHWDLVEVTAPAELAGFLVDKGSVAVDGVSLTVVRAGKAGFSVSLIPETLARTTLGAKRPGDRVNLEVDVLAKYLQRYLESHLDRHVESYLRGYVDRYLRDHARLGEER